MIEEMVLYSQYGNSQVFPILQILYLNLNYKTTTFHIDHIYPKSKFNEKNKNWIKISISGGIIYSISNF